MKGNSTHGEQKRLVMDFDPGMQGLWHNNICILKSTEKKNNNTTNDNHVNSKISKLQICTALLLCSVTDIILLSQIMTSM